MRKFEAFRDICIRLSTERDLNALLGKILREARRWTGADAGTLYMVEGECLCGRVVQNDTLSKNGAAMERLKTIRIPLDASTIAGACAVRRELLNVPDVKTSPYYNPELEKKLGYAVVAMMVVPMTIQHEGGVDVLVGVLQLLNAKGPEGMGPFDSEDETGIKSLASIAAVAVENARAFTKQRELFDSFVKSMVKAVDERDPCTAGHSARVSAYSLAVAQEFEATDSISLEVLRFSATLHDIGKLAVSERVLTKARKLSDERMAVIQSRIDHAKYAEWVGTVGPFTLEQWDAVAKLIERVNMPGFVSDEDIQKIQDLAANSVPLPHDGARPLLDPGDVEALCVRRGNLTDAERREIQSHATKTHRILSRLAFPEELSRVASVAGSHHERLDGSGYPFGLKKSAISLEAQIICVADFFDALTSADRPYKKSIPLDKSLDIIRADVERGAIRRDVFEALTRAIEHGRIKAFSARRAKPQAPSGESA